MDGWRHHRRDRRKARRSANLKQLALWSAANLAGVATGLLVIRETFFRRLLNRVAGKRRRKVLRVRRPASEQSLPLLADAVVGSSKSTIVSVFGPPRSAVLDGLPPSAHTFWRAQTWYYPLAQHGHIAMAIAFDQDHAAKVEFFQAPPTHPRSAA